MDLQLTKTVRIGALAAASCFLFVGCGDEPEVSVAASDGQAVAASPIAEDSIASVVLDMHESIASCMKSRGWQHEVVAGSEAAVPISERGGFISKYGYGIANRPAPGEYEPTPDPNAVYTNSLSDEERATYLTDLFGQPQPQLDAAVFTGESCGALAEQAASLELGGASLQDATTRAAELAAADSEVLEANGEWSDCMKEKGYEYSLPHEPAREIAALFRQVAGQEQKDPDSPEGQALQQRELNVAVDDWACYQEAGLREAREASTQRANRTVYQELAAAAEAPTE